jgi:hypothetical protein
MHSAAQFTIRRFRGWDSAAERRISDNSVDNPGQDDGG